jgi:hypothetical protein
VDPDRLLHLLDARLEWDDRLLLLVDLIVHISGQRAGDGGELVVELGRLVGRPRNDERRPGLVDQDRVDLIDDRVIAVSLYLLVLGPGQVVT